jgi:hypothetical protein
MLDLFSGVKTFAWFLRRFLVDAAPVDVAVEKWKEFNSPFIKQQQFNRLDFSIFIRSSSPIALKKGIDNFALTL